MAKIEQSIEVDVPVREAYDQWTQFESFPSFMEDVESVRQTDDKHLHWVASVGGRTQSWDAEITEQVPDRRIAWRSTSGDPNAGAVGFQPVGDEKTQVTLTMDVQPQGVVETVGTAVGLTGAMVRGDLERFKSFIEERHQPTGAWRGEIKGGDVVRDDTTATGRG